MNFSKQFTRREKVLLVIMALVLVLGAYFWLVQEPVSQQTAALRAAQADAETELIVLEAKAQSLEQMRSELDELKAQPGTLAETPRYDNLQHVIALLNTAMANTGDYTLSFQPVETPEEGNIVRRVIDMTFTCGSYDAARSVVKTLHDGPYRCQISTITAAPVRDEKQAGDAPASALREGAVQITLTITYFESLG